MYVLFHFKWRSLRVESSGFWHQLLPGFSPQWQAPSFSKTDHVSYLCGVRHFPRQEGPLWPWDLGTASLGHCLEPDCGVTLPSPVQRCSQGCPFETCMVPSCGNLRSHLSSSCSELLCPRPAVESVEWPDPSAPPLIPGRILPLVPHSYQTVYLPECLGLKLH